MIVGAYRGVRLFPGRTQSSKAPISGHTLFQPYSVEKLVHAPYQLIGAGFTQLSRKAIGPVSGGISTQSSSIGAGSLSALVME